MKESLLSDGEEVDVPVYTKKMFEQHHHHLKTPAEKAKEAAFESLDYDFFQNSVFFRERIHQRPSYFSGVNLVKWVSSFLIGVGTGLVGFTIDYFIKLLTKYKFVLSDMAMRDSWWSGLFAYMGINAALVCVATFLVAFIEPIAGGSGIPEIKCYLNGINVPGLIRLKTLCCKAIGVLFSVAGGLEVGKEGPMIHSGAIVGGGISQGKSVALGLDFKSKHWRSLRCDKEKRDFVAVGAAAGVSAAFGAPIGGVLFSLEEGASHWNQMLTWQSFVAATMATFTLNVFMAGTQVAPAGQPTDSVGWNKISYKGIVDFGSFEGRRGFALYDVPFMLIVAIIGGFLGAFFNFVNTKLTQWRFKHIPVIRPWRRAAEALLVAVACAAVNFTLPHLLPVCRIIGKGVQPYFLSNSYVQYYCPFGEYNEMATLSYTGLESALKHLFHQIPNSLEKGGFQQFSFATLMIYFFFFFWMAVWTYGIAVPSGLFVPSLLGGAIYGRACGELLLYLGISVDPGAYALIGAASWLGGMARMTISLCAILIEATDAIKFGLPLMMALMVSKWIGDFFNIGLYDIHIHLKHVPLLEFDPPYDADLLHAQDIMSKPVHTMPLVIRVRDAVRMLRELKHSGFPIVASKDQNRTQNLKGMILRSELSILLSCRAFVPEKPSGNVSRTWKPPVTPDDFRRFYPRFPAVDDIGLLEADMDQWLDLSPYINASPPVVQEWAPVSRVYRLFRIQGLRHMPVVDSNLDLVGIITRKNLTEHYISEKLLSLHAISYRAAASVAVPMAVRERVGTFDDTHRSLDHSQIEGGATPLGTASASTCVEPDPEWGQEHGARGFSISATPADFDNDVSDPRGMSLPSSSKKGM